MSQSDPCITDGATLGQSYTTMGRHKDIKDINDNDNNDDDDNDNINKDDNGN